MKYDLSKEDQVELAYGQLAHGVMNDKTVEIKTVQRGRSLNQNAYLHLLLGAFGSHFGYTLEESKLIYKEINKALYHYKKKGRTFIRSSADLTKEDMQISIDRFMKESAEAGCELPLATNQEQMMYWENQIEINRKYL